MKNRFGKCVELAWLPTAEMNEIEFFRNQPVHRSVRNRQSSAKVDWPNPNSSGGGRTVANLTERRQAENLGFRRVSAGTRMRVAPAGSGCRAKPLTSKHDATIVIAGGLLKQRVERPTMSPLFPARSHERFAGEVSEAVFLSTTCKSLVLLGNGWGRTMCLSPSRAKIR